MATIQRPLKLYGTRKYVDEVAADTDHKAPILSAEVDADLDGIYAAWNGGVDATNIKPGVITSTHLADGSVTDPKIVGLSWGKLTGVPTYFPIAPGTIDTASIADGAITGAKIADGTVSNVDLANGSISLPKIAVTQTTQAATYQRRNDTVACPSLNSETLYLEQTFASRGGWYLIVSALHVVFGMDASGGGFRSNLRLDGTGGVATDGAIIDFQWHQAPSAPAGTVVPATLMTCFLGWGIPGNHRAKITGIPINRFVGFAHIDSGWSAIIEFA